MLHVLGYKAIFASLEYSFHRGCMQAGSDGPYQKA